jgi:hypothetical protein
LEDNIAISVLFARTITSFFSAESDFSVFPIEYFVPFGRKYSIGAYGNTTTYLFKPADLPET